LKVAEAQAATPAQRWMARVQAGTQGGDWAGVIRACAGGLQQLPGLGLEHHPALSDPYLSNLALARRRYRRERSQAVAGGPAQSQVVVVSSELSHNSAGRAHTLLLTYQQLGYPATLLGCHFPLRNRPPVLWEPLQSLDLPVHAFVVNDHSQFFWQAWALVLQHPADLVHLSKPRLPAVVFGLLYKLLWGAAVLMDIDDEELCFVGEHEPISVDALKREQGKLPPAEKLLGPLWTRLAVDLGQRFDGITVANTALQQRYGGTVIPHGRDPQQLRPITAIKRSFARRRYGIPEDAKVVLFFGTPRRHKGLLEVAAAVAALPESLQPLFVVAGAIPDAELERELVGLLPAQRLRLLGNQPFERGRDILALADLEVLLSSGEVAAFQSPAKLSDALAVGLPVLVSEAAPLQEAIARGWAVRAEPERLAEQLQQWLGDVEALEQQGARAREGFLEALALPVVADQLKPCVAAALAAPGPVDGQQLSCWRAWRRGLQPRRGFIQPI
jgi:glycosyltransferase involved in cell wall biosynthesis